MNWEKSSGHYKFFFITLIGYKVAHTFFSDYLIVFFKNDKFYLFTPFACVDLYMRILFPKGSFNQLKKCLLPPSPWIILGPE